MKSSSHPPTEPILRKLSLSPTQASPLAFSGAWAEETSLHIQLQPAVQSLQDMRDKVWGLSHKEKEECLEEETKGSLKEGVMGGGEGSMGGGQVTIRDSKVE